MAMLTRITTDYSELQDRLKLSGEVDGGETQIVWVSQRLAQRLFRAVLKWVYEIGGASVSAEVMQEFSQQAALAEQKQLKDVVVSTEAAEWLAHSIDLTTSKDALSLVFKNIDGQDAQMAFSEAQVRQWLSIVVRAYEKAEWPMDIWPEWLSGHRSDENALEEHFIH